MSASKRLKSVVRSSNEIFQHLWNDSEPGSIRNEAELPEQNIISEHENYFDS